MGVELRKGRPYLYQRKREAGRVRCEYLGPLSPAEVRYFRGRAESERSLREVERADRAAEERSADAVAGAAAEFDRLADRVFRVALYLAGYAPHKRGEWRKKRGGPVSTFDELGAGGAIRPPLVKPPAMRPEDQEVLDRAGRGDWSALPAVQEMLKNRSYLDAIGETGELALLSLIASAAGSNVAVALAIREKHREYLEALVADGPEPTFAERLEVDPMFWTSVGPPAQWVGP